MDLPDTWLQAIKRFTRRFLHLYKSKTTQEYVVGQRFESKKLNYYERIFNNLLCFVMLQSIISIIYTHIFVAIVYVTW